MRLRRVETLNAALLASEECPGAETAALVTNHDEQLLRAREKLARDARGRNAPASAESSALASMTPIPVGHDNDAAVVDPATEAARSPSHGASSLTARLGTRLFSGSGELDLAELDRRSFSERENRTMRRRDPAALGRSISGFDSGQHHPCGRDSDT